MKLLKISDTKGKKGPILISATLGIIVSILLYVVLIGATATTTFYALKTSIPPRTQITADMMVPYSTNSTPPITVPYSAILEGKVYSKFALKEGDLLTESNTGPLTNFTTTLPSEYVLASFKTTPSNAVGGKVGIGDYVDIILLTQGEGGYIAKYILQKVLIMDATIDLDGGSREADKNTTTGGDNSAYRTGIPTLFTVGVSQADAAKIALANKYEIYLVKSSNDSVTGNAPNSNIKIGSTDIMNDLARDASKPLSSNNGGFEIIPGVPTASPNPSPTPTLTPKKQ